MSFKRLESFFSKMLQLIREVLPVPLSKYLQLSHLMMKVSKSIWQQMKMADSQNSIRNMLKKSLKELKPMPEMNLNSSGQNMLKPERKLPNSHLNSQKL